MAKQYRVGLVRRMVNKFVTGRIESGKIGEDMYLLTTLGRKSGKERTTPVTIARHQGHRYLVSPYGNVGWVHNIRDSGLAELSRGGNTEEIAVTEVAAATAAPVLKQYVGDVKVVRSYFDAKHDAPVAEFEAEASKHPVFQIGT